VKRAEKSFIISTTVQFELLIDALESLDLRYPEVGEPQRKELAVAKKELMANDDLWIPTQMQTDAPDATASSRAESQQMSPHGSEPRLWCGRCACGSP
jgi:hypothetical protein